MKKEKPLCRVADCTQHSRGMNGYGLCSMHYQRFWAHGEIFGATPMRAPLRAGHTRKDGYRSGTLDGVRKYEHIRVAEKAIGRPLPKGARVHHVNENRSDNRPENLVICPGAAYHHLLHVRMTAIAKGKPPHYRLCGLCKQYDDPVNMQLKSDNRTLHRECSRQYEKQRRLARIMA